MQVSKSSPLRDRIEAKLVRRDDCLLFTGALNKHGYGVIGHNGGKVLVHRAYYELEVGPIPEGKGLLHSCDTPACAEPDHLTPGTQLDNMRDCKAKGRNNAGEKNGQSKLSDAERKLIRGSCMSAAYLAEQYSVSTYTIYKLKQEQI